MPQLSPIVQHPPAALEQALQRLGRNIRTARLRRRWRLEDVADPDRDGEGKTLEAARQPGQAPRRHRFDDDF